MGSPSKNKYLPRSHVRFQSVTQVDVRQTGNPRRRCESREPSTSRYIGCPVCATAGVDAPFGGGVDGAPACTGGWCRPIRPRAFASGRAEAPAADTVGCSAGGWGRACFRRWKPRQMGRRALGVVRACGAPTSRSRGAAAGRRFPDSSGSRRRCWSRHCPRRYPTTSRRR